MLKMIFLLAGLAAGFGVGVWWGVHHPDQAATISAEEERRFLEAQMKITQATKDKLDQLARKSGKTVGSGFLSANAPDPDVTQLRDQQNRQLQDLQTHLDTLKKKS